MYLGDFTLGDTLDMKFTTVNSSGIPTTLGGSPVVSAYVGNGTTEITAGITLTTDFDSRTGLNNVRVVASSGNGFATATNVQLVITTGTVGGDSVVGYVIASFSIENRKAYALGVQAKADVNAEVVDTLNVDTYAEPGQETPAATNTLVKKIGYLFKVFRNRKTQTATQFSLYNDDATTIGQKATVSDDATTFDAGEITTGP